MVLASLLALLATRSVDTTRVVLVATADLHGYVTAWDYAQNAALPGGLVRAATVVDSLRSRYPGQVVLLDAGDALQGTALAAYFGDVRNRRPHPVVDAMSMLGYDAATPGDHDFDFGLDRFRQAIVDASFPWVSANLRVLPEDTLALKPYTVVRRGPVRIAVTGFLTPGVMVWHRDLLRGHYQVDPIERDAGRWVREMRHDADLVVVLSHSGIADPSSYDTTGVGAESAAWRFATGPDRPDVVVVGHSHGAITDSVLGGVHFVQPQPFARGLAVVEIDLAQGSGGWRPVRIASHPVSLDGVRPADRMVRRLAEPHSLTLDWVSTVVGEAKGRFSAAAARVEDTPLVRFILEVERQATGAQLAATPVVDLRAAIEPGEITLGELYRLSPGEQRLQVVRITGEQLKAYLEQCAWYFYADSTGLVAPNRFVSGDDYDLVGGVEYSIDLSRPLNSRVTRLTYRDRPVAPGDSFTLALSDYRRQGGGRFTMFAGAPVVAERSDPIRDLLVADVRRRKVLDPASFAGAGWRLEPEAAAARARALFVRQPAPAAPAPEPVAQPPALPPRPVSPEEQAARETAERERLQAEFSERGPLATLILPAEPGQGRSLPRLLADAFRTALRADVAVLTYAEVGAPLPAGPIASRDVTAATAGTERLLSLAMRGDEVRALLENLVAGGQPCCELSGLRVQFDPRRKAFERVRRVESLNGEELRKDRTYRVALSSRLVTADSQFALGASRCRAGAGCAEPGRLARWTVVWYDHSPADALRDYLRLLPQPVRPPDDPRLIVSP
jgi:2',3'-cyclic-nucleotide 2'-phosphodiesterase/3'-nucleotidase